MDLIDLMKKLTIKYSEENNSSTSSKQKFFKSVSANIDDVGTEVVLAEFSDKTLLIVSQYLKIGVMLIIQKDEVNGPHGPSDIYTTKVIFGATGEEQQAAARYLAEALKITKPLCLFLSLKSYDIENVKACKDIILDLKRDNN